MATKIILKKSTTGGSVPLAADLDAAEIAINLVDRKVYTKDGSGAVQRLDGAYIDSVAPSNPSEGDIWYDTANNLLKTHNGSAFVSAGYQTLGALEDVTLTSAADGEILRYDGSSWINNTLAEADIQSASSLESDVEALFSVTDNGGDGSLTYASGVFTYTGPSAAETRAHFAGGTGIDLTNGNISVDFSEFDLDDISEAATTPTNLFFTDARARAAISVTDNGGDGSLSYDNATGEISYTGPSAAETRAHFTGGTGISLTAGTFAVDFTEFDTGSIVEGSKLFYTDERVDDRVSNLLIGGEGISATYDDVNNTLTLAAEAPTAGFDLSNNDTDDLAEGTTNRYYLDSRARSAISVTDNGGDGSLSYSSATGVITYTGPSAAETRAHFTGGTGVTITNGSVAIGQSVGTTDDVTFGDVETDTIKHTGGTITLDPTGDGANTGEVIVAGNLTVNGTTTSVNSNEVNIGDSVIVLNADETAAPSQDGGIEIERGTAANVSFVWDETNDYWTLGNEQLANVTIDGGTY